MKVKFDLSEDLRLKAYYLLQLAKKEDAALKDISFDVWLNSVAKSNFDFYLDMNIKAYESRLLIGGYNET